LGGNDKAQMNDLRMGLRKTQDLRGGQLGAMGYKAPHKQLLKRQLVLNDSTNFADT